MFDRTEAARAVAARDERTAAVQKIIQAAANRSASVWKKVHNEHKEAVIVKLRTMMKSGVPRDAVEQKAFLEGIDPCLVLGPSRNQRSSSAAMRMKRRSEKARAVRQAANLQRIERLAKVGVPLCAIENRAFLDQMEMAKTCPAPPPPALSSCEAAVAVDQQGLFRVRGQVIKFLKQSKGKPASAFNPSSSSSISNSDLSILVRKTVHSLCRVAKDDAEGKSDEFVDFAVDMNTLKNALGAFRGVQRDRDLYNSTISPSSPQNLDQKQLQILRRPFLEHLNNLGIRPSIIDLTKHDPLDIPGLDDLVRVIESRYETELQSFRTCLKTGVFSFEALSEIFSPGSRVLAKSVFASGVDMICEVSWSQFQEGKSLFGTKRMFQVCFQFVAAVGGQFTLCNFVETMDMFDGTRPVKDLPFIPLSAFDAGIAEQLNEEFRQRGKRYSQCASASFLEYSQASFYPKGSNGSAWNSKGRIMVDIMRGYDAGHSLSFGYDPMITSMKHKFKEYLMQMRQQSQLTTKSKTGSKATPFTDNGMLLFDEVPDEYLEMTWPAVVGFSLTSKVWGDVLVDGLSEISFQEAAFDKLVLPPGRKRMINALVRHSNDSFSDIVNGKGEGSVFLLYGPAGVGKTLTAEAISEMLHRPLYSVSVGQLGTTPAELEAKLGEILDLCSKWDALILLDEADIFLEKRTAGGSLERNAMVSVMLRLVEYFKGTLFLTSNRVESLDPAFKTRITFALCYDHLTMDARRKIWNNLLEASGHDEAVKCGVIDTRKLAEIKLNGREIKNAIRLALSLAAEDGTALTQDIVCECVQLLQEFNLKMEEAHEY